MSDENFEIPDHVPDELMIEQILKYGADKLAENPDWQSFWGQGGLGAGYMTEGDTPDFVVLPRDLFVETLESERFLAELYVSLLGSTAPEPTPPEVLQIIEQFNSLILVNKVVSYIASVAPGVSES